MNSTNLLSTTDMGQDGRSGANNNNIARDAYGFALHYNSNADYTPIGATNPFANATTAANYQALYNGNIAAQTVNIKKLGKPRMYVYGYDQLNRIKRVNAFTGLDSVSNVWTPVDSGKYRENFTYDGNGNILKANRNGNVGIMDSLTYQYTRDASGRLVNNKLNYVSDATNNVAYSTDIKDQPANNYNYDAIGNLILDAQAGISNIDWSVYGKIKAITKNSGNIAYTYDPSGQRVTKTIGTLSTFYVRDAQGNALALYDNLGGHSNWKEQDLYGSSRLGMWTPNVNLATGNAQTVFDTLGRKFFELTNHLGNVLETITDRRLQAVSGSVVDHYEPDVASAQSYYAFGMEQPGMTYNSANYRYGFNGKENDNEVKGVGNQQDYGMRIYDPRLGRFLSMDPLIDEYPELTPYQFASNTPIEAIDRDGLEAAQVIQAINSISIYLNTPASYAERTGLAYQTNYNSSGVNLSADDYVGLTNGEYILESLGQTLVHNLNHDLLVRMPQHPNVHIEINTGTTALHVPEVEVHQPAASAHIANDEPVVSVEHPTVSGNGRGGKQARIKAMADDPKESSANRGWVKNEKRRIKSGNGSANYRMPNNGRESPGRKAADKGLELAHPHDAPASQGNSYSGAKVKNHADHKVETRIHRQNGRY